MTSAERAREWLLNTFGQDEFWNYRTVDKLAALLTDIEREARRDVITQINARLEHCAKQYEAGGHTHRAKVLRALALEFAALEAERRKAGGTQ